MLWFEWWWWTQEPWSCTVFDQSKKITYGIKEYLVQVMPRVCSTQSFGTTANALVWVVVMNTGTLKLYSIRLITMRKVGIFILLVDCPKTTRVVCNIEEFRIKTCVSTAHQRGAIVALLFSEYLSLVPKSGPFYRRLIKNSSPPKFSQQWLGRNTLATIVKSFCIKAGFTGNYTNHSGKVTCATIVCFAVEWMSSWLRSKQVIEAIQFEHTREPAQNKMRWFPIFCSLLNPRSQRKKTSHLLNDQCHFQEGWTSRFHSTTKTE